VAVGDFNGDGKPDLAVANERSGNVSVLLNTCVQAGINLAVERSKDVLTVSWPLGYTNFVFVSATNLASTNWQSISNEITLPIDQPKRFFRLRRP